jgi:chromosome segregation ATPase
MSVNSIINYDIDNNHDWEEDAFYWYEENRKNAGKWIDLLEELNKRKEEEKNGYFEKNKEISELNAKCKRLQEKIENKDNIIKEKERMIAILEKAIDMLSSKKEYHSKK